jgi:hypothetical protein
MSNDNASPLSFDAALAAFVAAVNEGFDKQNAKMADTFPDGYYKPVQLEAGSKNIRVVSVSGGRGGSRSCYCFVEKATGNVLKSAGWKAPAKGARANIYKPESYAAARNECYTGWLYRR